MRGLSATFVGGLTLLGCANSQINPISKDEIAAVVSEVKREVGQYQAASTFYKRHPDQDSALKDLPRDSTGMIKYACGNGDINFDISKVSMELTTTADYSKGGGVAVTIPIAPMAGVTATPSFDYTSERNTTQKLTGNYRVDKAEFGTLWASPVTGRQI